MPIYHNLTSSNLVQNWDPGYITANDSWPADGSFVGYLGDIDPSTSAPMDPRNFTSPALGAVDVVANTTSANP